MFHYFTYITEIYEFYIYSGKKCNCMDETHEGKPFLSVGGLYVPSDQQYNIMPLNVILYRTTTYI